MLFANTLLARLTELRLSSALAALCLDNDAFAQLLTVAIQKLMSDDTDPTSRACQAFLANVFSRHVHTPEDLLSLCALLKDKQCACDLMQCYMRSDLADYEVIFQIVRDVNLFATFPADGAWQEVAILLYGSYTLNQDMNKKLHIDEFLPQGIEIDPAAARALISSAAEHGQLCAADMMRLSQLFPDDQRLCDYSRQAFAELNQQESE